MRGLEKATITLLVIDFIASIAEIIYFVIFTFVSLPTIGSVALIFLLFTFFGVISLSIVITAFIKFSDGGSTRCGVALILLSFFFPAGILYIIYSNFHYSRVSSLYSVRERETTKIDSQSRTLKVLPSNSKINPCKAIYLIGELYSKKIILSTDYRKLMDKYQNLVEEVSDLDFGKKINPYTALYQIGKIKNILKQTDFEKLHKKYLDLISESA